MRASNWCVVMMLTFAADGIAADFGTRGGPEPANIEEIAEVQRQEPYDMELLISYGTSKGGSAGHLALAIRDQGSGDDMVYSANFYADRQRYEGRFYTEELMLQVPKREYLFGTSSSLGEKASFGLDFGEIYKRSVIGVRVYGVPASEKEALVAFFNRINEDYHDGVGKTDYHDEPIKYDYLRLNCAKTIGMGFKLGAGYKDLEVKSATLFSGRRVVAAVKANIPTEMAMKLLKQWDVRGYGLDVVLYKKYEGSTYLDPNEEEQIAFKDLPNRFPSVLSLDFRKEQGHYEDFNNLFAIYVLYNMGKYSVRMNDETRLLEIENSKSPMSYRDAARLATESARSDQKSFRRRLPFRPRGTAIGDPIDNSHVHDLSDSHEAR